MKDPNEARDRSMADLRPVEPDPDFRGVASRGARAALLVLLGLVGVAVYAPLLAGDRPLVVRAAFPGLLEPHLKRLAKAYPYDVRHGLPGVRDAVARTLAAMRSHLGPEAAARVRVREAEWKALGEAPADPAHDLAFLERVHNEFRDSPVVRRTLFPAVAAIGGTEALFFGLFPALAWLATRRRRSKRSGRTWVAGLAIGALAVVITTFCSIQPRVSGVDFKAELPRIRAADSAAVVWFPPIPFGSESADPDTRLLPPLTRSSTGDLHWLGTDDLGRDLACLLVLGTRTSILVGFASVALLLLIGIPIGAAAGYLRGPVDLVISRVIEVFPAFPALILVLAAVAFLQGGIWVVILVIGCTRWTTAARLVRAEFFRLRRADFVAAARTLGFSTPRILFRHMLPNAIGPVVVHAAFAVAAAVLVESSLAFLGLGDRGVVSWGQVIDRGRHFLEAWWITVFPGVVLFATILALRVLGEGIRSQAGPRYSS